MRILEIINDGFEEVETFTPLDVLKRAGINVTLASNKKTVIGAHGIQLTNVEDLKNLAYFDYDFLILPGGPQWKKNLEDELYLEIAEFYAKNKKVAAICASPTILGHLGYLRGIKYTCFPPMNEDFGGTFTGSAAEYDKNIITGRGAGASFEFAFKILEVISGNDEVEKIKNEIFY